MGTEATCDRVTVVCSAWSRADRGALGDFDADGKPDVVTSNTNSGDVTVLRNKGDGTFAAGATYKTATSMTGIATADFNADGRADIVVTSAMQGTASVLMSTQNGFAAPLVLMAGSKTVGVATGDFNGDKNADFAVIGAAANLASPSLWLVVRGA